MALIPARSSPPWASPSKGPPWFPSASVIPASFPLDAPDSRIQNSGLNFAGAVKKGL